MRVPHNCSIYPDDDVLDQIYDRLETGDAYPWHEPALHLPEQDTGSEAWFRLLELIETASKDGTTVFNPSKALGWELWSKIITLPTSIALLKTVKTLHLYGSNLLSIPPEIGDMSNLETFIPYTSYGLHWFPYEITRCTRLKSTAASTRALYGNYKFRPPFPKLNDVGIIDFLKPKNCSVCGAALNMPQVHQAWHSLGVGTDVLPLLINACSITCIESLPNAPGTYVKRPHTGGIDVVQASVEW